MMNDYVNLELDNNNVITRTRWYTIKQAIISRLVRCYGSGIVGIVIYISIILSIGIFVSIHMISYIEDKRAIYDRLKEYSDERCFVPDKIIPEIINVNGSTYALIPVNYVDDDNNNNKVDLYYPYPPNIGYMYGYILGDDLQIWIAQHIIKNKREFDCIVDVSSIPNVGTTDPGRINPPSVALPLIAFGILCIAFITMSVLFI